MPRKLSQLAIGAEAVVSQVPVTSPLADLGLCAGTQVRLLRRIGQHALHLELDAGLECGVSVDLAEEVELG